MTLLKRVIKVTLNLFEQYRLEQKESQRLETLAGDRGL